MTNTEKNAPLIPREGIYVWRDPNQSLNRHGVYFTPKTGLTKYVPSQKDKPFEVALNPDPAILEKSVTDYINAINNIICKHNLRASIYLSIFTYGHKGKVSISLYAGTEFLQKFDDIHSMIEYVVLLLGIIECQSLGLIEVHAYKPGHDDK